MTVAGPAIKKPGNYLVPLGTSIRFVLERLGYRGSSRRVILGGRMILETAVDRFVEDLSH